MSDVAVGSRVRDDSIEGSMAKAVWHPSREEEDALAHQGHVATMGRVDQIWPWLAQKHGQILAVDAPHAAHPERFCYGELAAQIALAAAAFRHHGIGSGEVVAFFAENSPRWLVEIGRAHV